MTASRTGNVCQTLFAVRLPFWWHNGGMAKKGRCDWCGTEVLDGDGFRLLQPKRNLGATFCRLEHVVPWLMKKNDWHIWNAVEVPEAAEPVSARTGEELDENAYWLVHHRGEVRIPDGFNSTDEVLEWAKAGGRYSK